MFDPLGFLAPVLIRGKLLFQKVWKLNELSWDDLLPAEFIDEWNNLVPDLISLKNIALPRKIIDSKFNYEVHVFCDASPTAYGCVIYFLNFDKCNMLLSKPKVAPLKSRSLPQLELTSIYLGVKLVNNVLSILNNIVVKNIFIWSDNEASLQWIKNSNSNITFVKNRVSEINELYEGFKFLYVNTKSNPADLLTKGVTE